MKYYKTGEFAKMANLTIRTIRYYDQIGLLKPSQIAENGYRLYTDHDFMKLQKIISLKNLGFSLDDIFSMTINDNQLSFQTSLALQKRMIDQRIKSLLEMKEAITQTETYLEKNQQIDWQQLLNQINFSTMENRLIEQYKNANNIDVRISLHEKYSISSISWFEWLFNQYQFTPKMEVLEIGCGNGELWKKNKNKLNELHLTLTDISDGMLEDAKEQLKELDEITYVRCDAHQLPFEGESFDVVIANHVLFYLHDLNQALKEIKRVLKPRGTLYCSTYGKHHMQEITDLIKEYNTQINLSNVPLYEVFGLENGQMILENDFNDVETRLFEDGLVVTEKKDLIDYILSCHGNQSSYIIEDYEKFESLVDKKMQPSFKITKEAGMFKARKQIN